MSCKINFWQDGEVAKLVLVLLTLGRPEFSLTKGSVYITVIGIYPTTSVGRVAVREAGFVAWKLIRVKLLKMESYRRS